MILIYSPLLLILLFKVSSESRLIFSDEFNENHSFDWSKWRMEGPLCIEGVASIYCGLLINNGTLIIMRDNYKCRNIYSPSIRTKQNFIYGRFEIRAALPRADNWDYSIYLDPVTNSKSNYGGEIQLAYNSQNRTNYGIKFGLGDDIIVRDYKFDVQDNLNEFNVYAFEWTDTQLKWIFNERVLLTFNITKELANNYNPFDKPFKFLITMWEKQVFLPNLFIDAEESDWCPLLLVDYVRVYQFDSKEDLFPNNHNKNNVTRLDMCKQILASFQPKPESWRLVFSDEFNDKVIDESNWKVNNQVDFQENLSQNQTQTKSTSILSVSEGVLLVGIIQDDGQPISPSSISITSRESFTYGKFVARAVLPKGMLLKPSVHLEPLESSGDERIEIVANTQSEGNHFGIDFPNDPDNELQNNMLKKPINTDSPFDFHNYVLEWTEKELHWMVDDNHLYRTKFGRDFNTFCKPFKLTISLETIDNQMSYQNNTPVDGTASSTCPLLILDYIRVYQVMDKSTKAEHPVKLADEPWPNLLNSSKICTNIMLLNQRLPEKDPGHVDTGPPSKNNLILYITISTVIIITIIITLIVLEVYIFKRFKTKIQTKEQNVTKKLDDNEIENIYDVPNENEYHYYNKYSAEDPYYIKITHDYEIEPGYLDMH